MNFIKTTLSVMAMVILLSCNQFGDPKKEFAGDYKVRVELDKEIFAENAIRDSINLKMAEMKKELGKAQKEMQDSFNLEKIDTTTPEGKIEYAAKSFAKGITGLAGPLGELGKSLGEMGAGIAKGSVSMIGDLIGNIRFNVSLNQNGTVSTDYDNVNFFGTRDATWDVRGDKFIITGKDNEKQEFDIIGKKEGGFELRKDKVRLVFDKQKAAQQ